MNVPSLKVLDTIGFDAAIDRASRMLGITDPTEIELVFPRKYPLGLGIITVSPLEMAQAFATFPNQGRAVEPVAISFVEDRNGRILLEPEKELHAAQMRAGRAQQIMPPQDAYIMTSLLQGVVSEGTLRGAAEWVGGFGRPIAGKTGTTQNWSDAWTVGFTPQITTAIWFGFDERGYSLGINQTGATSAGPAWAEFMKAAHQDLPVAAHQVLQRGDHQGDLLVRHRAARVLRPAPLRAGTQRGLETDHQGLPHAGGRAGRRRLGPARHPGPAEPGPAPFPRFRQPPAGLKA
jgi:penicillin-binding protein 1A